MNRIAYTPRSLQRDQRYAEQRYLTMPTGDNACRKTYPYAAMAWLRSRLCS